jgi:hypothetical protein
MLIKTFFYTYLKLAVGLINGNYKAVIHEYGFRTNWNSIGCVTTVCVLIKLHNHVSSVDRYTQFNSL